ENDGRKSIINNAGDEILLAKGAPLFFSEGIFGITWQSTQSENSDTNRAYYADASGNNLFGRYFEEISPFQLGVAGVKPISNGKGQAPKNGAINTRGVMVVPPKFNRLHIQPDGNIIINPQLYYGLLDKEGNLLLDPEYDRIETFEDPNIIRVERGEKIGYIIQKEGKVVWAWPLQN
ncbi:MAG TPA: WG repeat-containing protein, partial [Saprospiraceae bacterium]|nr:WG repeat-containing protein [Saprospiraceae bacterium]